MAGLFLWASSSQAQGEEVSLLTAKGDCSVNDIALESQPGKPVRINLDLDHSVTGFTSESKSCLVVLEVPHLPEGYRVGVRPLTISGRYQLEGTGFSRVRVRYHYLRQQAQKRNIQSSWDKDSPKGQTFQLTGEPTIYWGDCQQTKFVIGTELIAGGHSDEDQAQIGVSSISFPELFYKKCSIDPLAE